MNSTYLLLIVVSILSALSCKNQTATNDKHILKQEYNDKKVLIFEQQYLKTDTGLIQDGYYKEYYDNGKLHILGYCKDGYIMGDETYYSEKGKLQKKLHYVGNFFVGNQQAYYDNGNLKLFLHYHSIKRPDDTTVTEGERFVVQLNENGELEYSEGHPFKITHEKEHIYTESDTVFIFCTFPQPPDDTKLVVQALVDQKLKKKSDTITNPKRIDFLSKSTYNYPFLCSHGSGKVTFIYSLYNDQNNKLILVDTANYEVRVN